MSFTYLNLGGIHQSFDLLISPRSPPAARVFCFFGGGSWLTQREEDTTVTRKCKRWLHNCTHDVFFDLGRSAPLRDIDCGHFHL